MFSFFESALKVVSSVIPIPVAITAVVVTMSGQLPTMHALT